MNWLRNWMYGRNGADQLSVASVVVGLILTLFLSFIRIPYLSLLSYVPYGYAFFRILSRNVTKRQEENRKFLQFWNPIQQRLSRTVTQLRDKDHKYFSCPSCKATLRVPKGKGKIAITCPKCRKEITKTT